MSEIPDLQQRMAERLSDTMRKRGVTQTDLASRLETSKQQIYKLEKGIVRLRDEWARKIAPHLDVSAEWLLFLSDEEGSDGHIEEVRVVAPATYVPIPTVEVRAGMGGGGIVEGAFLGAPRYFEAGFVTNELRARPEDLCLVEVEGQSMEPLLRNGDTVLVDRRKTNIGMEGIFVLHDGDCVVCKVVERVHGSEPPRIRIKSKNPEFGSYEVEAERCQILGRVVWFARRL